MRHDARIRSTTSPLRQSETSNSRTPHRHGQNRTELQRLTSPPRIHTRDAGQTAQKIGVEPGHQRASTKTAPTSGHAAEAAALAAAVAARNRGWEHKRRGMYGPARDEFTSAVKVVAGYQSTQQQSAHARMPCAGARQFSAFCTIMRLQEPTSTPPSSCSLILISPPAPG